MATKTTEPVPAGGVPAPITPASTDKRTAALERIRDAPWGAGGECALTALIREFQGIAKDTLA